MNKVAFSTEREQVLSRIRDEVLRMQNPEDIRQVLVAVRDGLGRLGVPLRGRTFEHRTELLLRQERDYLSTVMDGNPIPTFVIDPEHRVIHWNAACERLTGAPRARMLGHPVDSAVFYSSSSPRPMLADLVLDGDLANLEQHYRQHQLRRSTIVPRAFEATSRLGLAGQERDILFLASRLLDPRGRVIGAIATFQDITERREAELRLQESEERFRTTFEQAAVGIAHVGLDGSWLRVNSKLCDILGYTRAELLGRSFQDITHPEDLGDDLERRRRMLIGEIPSYAMEKRYQRPDGTDIWTNLTVALVRDERGAPSHFISVVEDISVRKDLEARLAQQRLRAVHADRMHVLGEMAAGVAHELNQPLMALSTTAEDIYLRLAEGLALEPSLLQEMMQDQLCMVERMSSIIDQLRAFSQDTSDAVGDRVSVNEIVQASLRMVGRQLANHGIEVAIELQPELPAVRGQGQQLEEVTLNLLTNARDAVDGRRTGGGEPTRSSDSAWRGRIEIRTASDLERLEVRLEISDNGGGIAPEALSRIFEPFFTTKPVGKGTGLGLAIAWGIAQRHDGRLEVENRPGEGATFRLVLPICRDSA